MAIDQSPKRSEVACPGRRMRWCLPAACGYRQVIALFYAFRGPLTVFALASLALAIWSGVRFGSLRAAVSYLEGFSIIAEPQKLSLEDVPVGEPVVVMFRLRNLTGNPVRIVGAVSDCGCLTAENLPFAVEAHDAASFRVRFTVPLDHTAPRASFLIRLHLDVEGPPFFLYLEATLRCNDARSHEAMNTRTQHVYTVIARSRGPPHCGSPRFSERWLMTGLN